MCFGRLDQKKKSRNFFLARLGWFSVTDAIPDFGNAATLGCNNKGRRGFVLYVTQGPQIHSLFCCCTPTSPRTAALKFDHSFSSGSVSPHAGIALAVARGFRNAREATEVHARLGTAPCVALNWGWSACFSPLLLIDDHRPSCDRTRTYGHPDHQTAIRGTMLLPLASSGTDARPRGHSPAAAPLQGGMEPNSPQ